MDEIHNFHVTIISLLMTHNRHVLKVRTGETLTGNGRPARGQTMSKLVLHLCRTPSSGASVSFKDLLGCERSFRCSDLPRVKNRAVNARPEEGRNEVVGQLWQRIHYYVLLFFFFL